MRLEKEIYSEIFPLIIVPDLIEFVVGLFINSKMLKKSFELYIRLLRSKEGADS